MIETIEFFDTHAHPTDESPEDFRRRTEAACVKYVLLAGSNAASSRLCYEVADVLDGVWFAAGIHPHEAGGDFSPVLDLLEREKCVAVGETGIDYYYEIKAKSSQMLNFEVALEAALNLKLPVIVHCRDKSGRDEAYSDCEKILADFAKSGGYFVMHCFAGGRAWLERFLVLGAYIGFGGIITFNKADNVRELLTLTPLDRILLETDSPYLAPVPYRGAKNHPSLLPIIASQAAKLLSRDIEDIAELCTANSFKLFNPNHRRK